MDSETSLKMAPFTSAWWSEVVEAWNAGPYVEKLAGLGVVSFLVEDGKFEPVHICWSNLGYAKLCESPDPESPSFSATTTHWLAFINAEFTATAGVMKGKLKYKGNLRTILPYSLAFNFFAQSARDLV